jgi:dihydrofolate reductase
LAGTDIAGTGDRIVRNLIVSLTMSLDGYYEGPGRNVLVLPMGEDFDAHHVELLRGADTLLLGRTSYEMFRNHWPTVVDDPSATPTNREISRLENAIDKVVVSDSLTPEQTEPWRHNTRIIRRADAYEQISILKRQPGKDIVVFGSHILWNDLLAHDLVDELHLMIGSVIVGGGTPAFVVPPAASLRLVEARAGAGPENALLRYAVHRMKM